MANAYDSKNQASLAEAKNLADSIVESITPLLSDPSRDEAINNAAGEISSAAELIKTSINSLTTTTNALAQTLDKNGVSAVVKSIDGVASSFEKQVKTIVDSLTGLKSAQIEHYKASEEKIKETSLKRREESDSRYEELYTLNRQLAEALSKGLANEAKILEESIKKLETSIESEQRKGIGRRDFGGRDTDNGIRFEGFKGSYGKGTDDVQGIGDLIGNFKKAFTVENGLNKTRDFLVNKSSNPVTGAIVGSIFNSISKKVRTRAAEKEQVKLDDQIFDERIKNEDTKAFLEEKYGNLDSAREAHRAQSADRRTAGKDIEKISKQKDEFLEKSRAVGYTDPEVEAHYEKLLKGAHRKYSSIGAEDRRGGLTSEKDDVVSSGVVRTTIPKSTSGSLSSLEDARESKELNETSVGIQEKQLEVLQSILEALGGGKGPAGLKKGKKLSKSVGEDGEDGDEEGGRDWLDTLADLSTILGGRGKRMPKGRRRHPKAGKARGLKGLLSKGGGKLKLVGGLLGAGGLLGGAGAVLEDGVETAGKAGGAKAGTKAAEKGLTKSVGKAGAKAGTKAAEKGLTKSVGKAGAKAVGKSALKKIPVIGALAGLGFAAGRAMDGDWLGAGGEALSGIASIVPGIGTAASVAIDAGLAARDIAKDGETPGALTLTDASVPLTTTALANSGNFAVNNSAGTAQVMNQLSEINSAADRAEKESIARISGAGAGAATASIINNTVSNSTVVQKPDMRNNEPTWMRQEALRYSPSNLGYVY
jgi:hypothetical protein